MGRTESNGAWGFLPAIERHVFRLKGAVPKWTPRAASGAEGNGGYGDADSAAGFLLFVKKQAFCRMGRTERSEDGVNAECKMQNAELGDGGWARKLKGQCKIIGTNDD
jgi:hypothetical protein